jgi:hypothetical protein
MGNFGVLDDDGGGRRVRPSMDGWMDQRTDGGFGFTNLLFPLCLKYDFLGMKWIINEFDYFI